MRRAKCAGPGRRSCGQTPCRATGAPTVLAIAAVIALALLLTGSVPASAAKQSSSESESASSAKVPLIPTSAGPNEGVPSNTSLGDHIEGRWDTAQLPPYLLRTYTSQDGVKVPTFTAGSGGTPDTLWPQLVAREREWASALGSESDGWEQATSGVAKHTAFDIEVWGVAEDGTRIGDTVTLRAKAAATLTAIDLIDDGRSYVSTEKRKRPIFSPGVTADGRSVDWAESGGQWTLHTSPTSAVDGDEQTLVRLTPQIAGCFPLRVRQHWTMKLTFAWPANGVPRSITRTWDDVVVVREVPVPVVSAKSYVAKSDAAQPDAMQGDPCSVAPAGQPVQFSDEVLFDGEFKPPVATLQATPDHGPASLRTVLSGQASRDEDGHIVEYRWDLTRNGSVDQVTATPLIETTYGPGEVTAALQVVDNDGLESDWAEVLICSAAPPTAEVPSQRLHGVVPNMDALLELGGRAKPFPCPGHPRRPKIDEVVYVWDDLGRSETWFRMHNDPQINWEVGQVSHFYRAGIPPPYDEWPNWRDVGRGVRVPWMAAHDTYGQWSNVVQPIAVWLNTPPKVWQGTHFCEPTPCSNRRRRAHPEAWMHDDLHAWAPWTEDEWWVFDNTGNLVHTGREGRPGTYWDTWISFVTRVPYVIDESPNGHDGKEWAYRREANWYRHNTNHSPTNVRSALGQYPR